MSAKCLLTGNFFKFLIADNLTIVYWSFSWAPSDMCCLPTCRGVDYILGRSLKVDSDFCLSAASEQQMLICTLWQITNERSL